MLYDFKRSLLLLLNQARRSTGGRRNRETSQEGDEAREDNGLEEDMSRGDRDVDLCHTHTPPEQSRQELPLVRTEGRFCSTEESRMTSGHGFGAGANDQE